jgi:RNA polymerase sigma factor (sigma-70 family)
MASELTFEELVSLYYQPLYQFAFSLTRAQADASDLTQQTFYIWATKGAQLRDRSKVKSWLFTTLHREFLNAQRRHTRFPHLELDAAGEELPAVPPGALDALDTAKVLEALARVDEPYRAPGALFYLQDCAYRDIAEILEVPVGTVKSRLSRGLAQLQAILLQRPAKPASEERGIR